jgi:hypothetical protein
MTEADWLKARDPHAMLRLVDRRLSARQWRLLAVAAARRAWDEIPPGPIADALDAADGLGPPADPERWIQEVRRATPGVVDAARYEVKQVVGPAAPDADPDGYNNPAGRLLGAAGRNAREAVDAAGIAAGHAVDAVLELFLPRRSDAARFDRVRQFATDADRARRATNLYIAQARKLAAEGDEMADPGAGRPPRYKAAAAADFIVREEKFAGFKHSDAAAKAEQADRRAVGRFLHEIAGNPFRPARFPNRWRTAAVVGLAEGIDADRGYDRLPILADALLEADCDDEAILRHCRGTEPHAADRPVHARGCWVVDLILGREATYFALPPVVVRRTPPALRPVRRPPDQSDARRSLSP